MENPNPQSTNPEDDLVEKAAKQLFNGQGLDLSLSIPSRDGPEQDDKSSMQFTNDDVYDMIQSDRGRIFDHTSREGVDLYLKFEEANSRRNKWTFENFKQMVNVISGVPADLLSGVARNLGANPEGTFTPQKIAGSLADGVLRDMRDLVGLLTQSEDPSSPLFWAKDLINGTGTVESRIKQFNTARWWGNRSNDLEEGKADIISDWVPERFRETASGLIDRKLANAISYIGLDAPHMIRDMWKRKGLADSVKAFKTIDSKNIALSKEIAETADWFDNNANKYKKLHYKLTGEALVATANIASKPFEFVKEKILRGDEAIEARLGYVPNEVHNGASTLLSDVTGGAARDVELGPIRGVLFSLGVKPITEYASVLGNELIDASQGVVSNPAFAGHDMLGRLSLNGGRIRMSKEAQAVAKFTNVVVGWPASMAFPAFKRAVGDSAYMGLLGYANARGEGASSGMGVGFAWGGLSGALRHIHNVYNHSLAHERIIDNFDNSQLKAIYKQNPEHAESIREYLKDVDSMGDNRVSATVRAQFMMGWHVSPETSIRYRTVEQLIEEYGHDVIMPQLDNNMASAKRSKGAELKIHGKEVIWLNKETATAETGVHEYSHRFLDVLFKRNDNSAHEAIRSFIGKTKDGGVISDKLMARLIADYSMRRFSEKPDGNWLNGPASAVWLKGPDGTLIEDKGYGNIAWAEAQIAEARRKIGEDPNYPFNIHTDKDTGVSKFMLFHEHPLIEKMMHEVFAYNQSNSLLRKAPDIFLRDPDYRSVKATMENWFTLLNQRKVNDMETAGILLRKKTDEGGVLLETLFWDDGNFMSLGLLDNWTDNVMKDVMRYGDVNITTLTGERAEAFMKQSGKQRFLKGGKIKTKKEIEDQITADADAIAGVLDALPDADKPKWTFMSTGSKRINLSDLSEEAWKKIRDSEIYSLEEYNLLRGMVDVIKQVDAGKPVFNTFTGQYLGHSKQHVEAALGQRLKGLQVPVTLRHFAPFSIELIVSKVDETGAALRNPRSHVTIHAMDVSVLNRRKMNLWQRPDVKSLFRDFGHFSETFVGWYEQHSLDPSIRKPSAEFLKQEFGSDAVRVRDIMYEVWGGKKRNDESYINAPEGYAGGRDGPNYPIHSLRFDLLANVQKQSQIFPEAFRGDLGGLRFNLGVAYEPMRRNAMIGGFVERELANGRKFYTDGNGYEIRGSGTKFQLFNMFGNLVGVFRSMAKAQSAAEKDLRKIAPEELGSLKEDMGDQPISEEILDVKVTPISAFAGGANMMISKSGSAEVRIDTSSVPYKNFVAKATAYQSQYEQGILGNDFNKSPRVKVLSLLSNPQDILRAFPEADKYFIEVHPMAEMHGGWVPAVNAGPQMNILGFAHLSRFTYKGSVQTLSTEINEQFQKLIELKENSSGTRIVPHSSDSPLFNVSYGTSRAVSIGTQEAAKANNVLPSQVTQPMLEQWLRDESDKYVTQVRNDWHGNPNRVSQRFLNRLALASPVGQFSDGSPRVSEKVQTMLSGFINSPAVLKDANDWACDITEALDNGKMLKVQFMQGAFIFMDKAYLQLPQSVEALRKADPRFAEALKNMLQSSTLFHAVSKEGNRDVSRKSAPNNAMFETENLALGSASFLENPTPDIAEPFVITGYPKVDAQTASAVGTLFGGEGTIVVSVQTNDLRSTIYRHNNPRLNLTTEGATFMQGLGRDERPAGTTQQPANSRSGPLVGALSPNRQTILDITGEAIIGGYAPFLGAGRTGVFHSYFASGSYFNALATLGSEIGVPFDPKKHTGEAGMSLYVQMISDSGVDTPDKALAHRFAKGVLMIETGRSILSGDKERIYAKWDRANQRSGRGATLDADQTSFGENLVNAGFGQIAYALAMSKDNLDKLGGADRRRTKRQKVSKASFTERAMSTDAKTKQFSKSMLKLVDSLNSSMESSGFIAGSNKNVPVSRNMMIGGFHASTAREADMIADGAIRIVRTDAGRTYKAFEFSDKDARFITEKVGGKLHLIPFIRGGTAAFDSYYTNYIRGSAPLMETDTVKLGEIFEHDLLYKYYPSLRDVKVEWRDGYGAAYDASADVIYVGIDRFVGKEMHEKGSGEHVDYASFGIEFERNATELLLHEIQHSIQMREMWTDSQSVTESRIFRSAGLILAGNISGVAGKTKPISGLGIMENEGGRTFFTDEKSGAPTNYSRAEVLHSIMLLGNSPMHMHLRQMAYPNLIRVSGEIMLALADAHMHHPEGHPARANAQSLSRRIGQIRAEAIRQAEEFKSGRASEIEMKDAVCRQVLEFENVVETAFGALTLDNSPLAARLYNSMDNTLRYMRNSMRALNGYNFIASLADADPSKLDVTSVSVKLRTLFDTLAMMQYLNQRHEIDANLTEKRSKMTQQELNATGLNPDGSRASELDRISGAMDIGFKGNTLRNIGIALKNKTPIRVANMMVGGTGDNLRGAEASSDIFRTLGKGALISWTIKAMHTELRALNIISVFGNGWEVGEDGVPVLVNRTALIRTKKDVSMFDGNDAYQDAQNTFTGSTISTNESSIGLFNAVTEDGKRTISLDDIVRFVDGVVVNENEIRTPTEAMDRVIQDDFPSVIELGSVEAKLRELGVSEDGIALANIELLSQTNNARNQIVSKGELIDLMAVFHRQFISERTVSQSVGPIMVRSLKLDPSKVTPQILASEVRKRFSKGGNQNFSSYAFWESVWPAVNEQSNNDTYRTKDIESSTAWGVRTGFLGVATVEGRLEFAPSRPSFVDADVWDLALKKWKASGLFDTEKYGVLHGFDTYDSRASLETRLRRRAEEMNRRLARKFFLLKPFYERALKSLETFSGRVSEEGASKMLELKIALLDSIVVGSIKPELDAFRSDNAGRIHRQLNTTYRSEKGEPVPDSARSFNHLALAPQVYSTGFTSTQDGMAYVEMQALLPVAGLTSVNWRHGYEQKPHPRDKALLDAMQDSISSSLWDKATSTTYDHLLHVHNSALTLQATIRHMVDEAEASGVTDVERIRLLADLAESAVKIAKTSTLLIGDGMNSASSEINRGMQAGNDYQTWSTEVIQDALLLRGYRGTDNSLVISENLLADTVAGSARNAVVELPFYNNANIPAPVGDPNTASTAVTAYVSRDMAIRTVLFGNVHNPEDPTAPSVGPMSYIVPIIQMLSTMNIEHDGFSRDYRAEDGHMFTSGTHPLHTAFYVAANELRSTSPLNGALNEHTDFYQIWGGGFINHTLAKNKSGISGYVASAAFAPVLASAFGEKGLVLRNGKLVVRDILTPEQRNIFNSLREAYRDGNHEQSEARDALLSQFFGSLSESQKSSIFSNTLNANSAVTISVLIGVMNAMKSLEALPQAAGIDAILNGDAKKEMARQLELYLVEGLYLWEQGTADVGKSEPMFTNRTPDWMLLFLGRLMENKNYQHVFMATLAKMDMHAKGYIPQVGDAVEGRDLKLLSTNVMNADSPVASLSTTVSPAPYAGGTVSAPDDGKLHRVGSPSRAHSWGADDSFGWVRGSRFMSRGVNVNLSPLPADGPQGLGQALINIYDPMSVGGGVNVTAPIAEADAPVNSSDPILGIHNEGLPVRGNPISQKLLRQNMVDSVIRQARSMGSDVVSLEPARFRNSGRIVSISHQWNVEGDDGRAGVGNRVHTAGASAVFSQKAFMPSSDEYGTIQIGSPAFKRPMFSTPMRGFAWKRLEDGRIVINITGDHTAYKAGYLGNQLRPTHDFSPRTKLPIGFNIKEALGYDPFSGDISPAGPYLTLFGEMSTKEFTDGRTSAGMDAFFQLKGEAWRKQIIKSAIARLKSGDQVRNRYEGTSINRKNIKVGNSLNAAHGYELLLSSPERAQNDASALAAALSILHHSTGHQYVSFTLPANATPELVKAVMVRIMIGDDMSFLANKLNAIAHRDSGASPFLGDGENLFGDYFDKQLNSGGVRGTKMEQLLGTIASPTEMISNADSVLDILRLGGTQGSRIASGADIDKVRKNLQSDYARAVSRDPRIIADIEAFAGMVFKKEHGWTIPDAERHLAKQGDTTLAIELMFPNRPELTQFAWDGKESNGVSIVHRGPKSKPTGYFVTYNLQTGVDGNGDPVMTKKVVPVKTLAEAETLRNRYGIVTSKAILAQTLASAGFADIAVKDGVYASTNTDISPVRAKSLNYADGVLRMNVTDAYHVGDTDKAMSQQEAVAISQVLSKGDVLQTKVPQVSVRSANLMIGDRSARELEGMLRRKLTFGFGSGPIEFVSKMMRVVAYGRKKTGREAYPDAMTGSEWYKFLKENTVSKDEMRMTGIAFLLHDNLNTLLTRKDLAEFIYTVYPKTTRQMRARGGVDGAKQNVKLRVGNLSGIWDMPYLEDIQRKEDFVVDTHVQNLRKVNELIEKKLLEPDSFNDAMALRDSVMKSIDFTIKEMGMLESLAGKSLAEAIDIMEAQYKATTKEQADGHSAYGPTGESRIVRPSHFEYIMREAIWGRLGDQYRTIESALGDLGLINPYEIHHADTSAETNPFDPKNSGSMLGLRRGTFFAEQPNPSNVPIYNTQGFYHHGGNYHGSWATFKGFYQSNPIFSENWNYRMKQEFKTAVSTLNKRLSEEQNPERKKAISSVIDALVRVESVRMQFGNEVNIHDLSHYSENDKGLFQLGHIRTTQTVLNGEYGIASPTDPAFHGNDEVSGFSYQPEIVIGIEEIQSDSFQYNTFGETTKVERALPESIEQVEGFKFAGELKSVKERLASARQKVSVHQQTLRNIVQRSVDGRRGGDMRMHMAYMSKLMAMLSPYELYALRDTLPVKETGRTIEVPEAYRKYLGLSRIPVLHLDMEGQWIEAMEKYREGGIPADAVSMQMDKARQVSSSLLMTAYESVLRAMLPEKHMGLALKDRTDYTNPITWDHDLDGSGSEVVNPSFLFAILASQDPEVVTNAQKIHAAHENFRGATEVDWDGIARRTLDRIIGMRQMVLDDTTSKYPASKFAKAKMFDALVETYREAMQAPRNQSMAVERSLSGERLVHNEVYALNPESTAYEVIKLPRTEQSPNKLWFPNYEIGGNQNENPMRPDIRKKVNREVKDRENRNFVQLIAGGNSLSQTVATMVSPWASQVNTMGTSPVLIAELEVKLKELEAKVPVSGKSGSEPTIVTSMPFGVEDIYKPIAINGTVIRAANAGLSALTYADARHQVNRGHSMDVVPTFLAGRTNNIIRSGNDTFNGAMTILHLLPKETLHALHGGLFDRVSKMETPDVIEKIKRNGVFEHNGVSGRFSIHLAHAIKEAVPILASVVPDASTEFLFQDTSVARMMFRIFSGSAGDLVDAAESLNVDGDSYGNADTSLLSPDGIPYKPKDNTTPFLARHYGKVVSGEKTDGQRIIDSGVANIGQMFYYSEKGRAMGYVSQYGAPSWFIQSIMFGQKQSSIDGFSTDAFARPIVQVAADGTFALLDGKTGRVIMEKITDKGMLREAFFQNSKYVGKLPYISKFLSEWSPVGAYVTQGHSNGGNYGGDLVDTDKLTVPYKQTFEPSQVVGLLGDTRNGRRGEVFTSESSKSMSGLGDITATTGMRMWLAHTQKVDVSSQTQMANAFNTYMSCGGPVLRFKPNFPSEAHKKAFRKKIVEGIALLMPSSTDENRASGSTEVLHSLTKMYKNFSRVTGARKKLQQGEALEDEDESTRP